MKKCGTLTSVSGATRTGKGVFVIREISRKKTAIVWDLKCDRSEYPAKYRVFNLADLAKVCAAVNRGIVCYSGRPEDLDGFCKIAKLYAEKCGSDCAIVLDETSDITGTGKATGEYGELLRKGLNLGADIYSMCQRCSESDKTTVANASRFHFSTLGTPADRAFMAKNLGVPLSAIDGIKADFHKKEFDCVDVEKGHYWVKSRLSFRNGSPKFTPITKKNQI